MTDQEVDVAWAKFAAEVGIRPPGSATWARCRGCGRGGLTPEAIQHSKTCDPSRGVWIAPR